ASVGSRGVPVSLPSECVACGLRCAATGWRSRGAARRRMRTRAPGAQAGGRGRASRGPMVPPRARSRAGGRGGWWRRTWPGRAAGLRGSRGGPQARWWAEVQAKPQPWYVEAKVNAGAFAALAGLTLDADGGWHALAVGDCCVFHVRDDALLRAFPIVSAAQFD